VDLAIFLYVDCQPPSSTLSTAGYGLTGTQPKPARLKISAAAYGGGFGV